MTRYQTRREGRVPERERERESTNEEKTQTHAVKERICQGKRVEMR